MTFEERLQLEKDMQTVNNIQTELANEYNSDALLKQASMRLLAVTKRFDEQLPHAENLNEAWDNIVALLEFISVQVDEMRRISAAITCINDLCNTTI